MTKSNNSLHKVLYQKYRPNSFKEVIGQNVVVNMLRNTIKQNKVGNVYLFYGPHGIGKTTLARIFAKAMNCLHPIDGDACNECKNCQLINNNEALDLIEIDAASNNGVENVRSIIENASYLPSQLKKKVYIIDEAHMISTSGWNAFLKTLENSNNNNVFIFASTELEKFPRTILSRCLKFALKRLNYEELLSLINLVCKNENINIEQEAKYLLVEYANGSARDLLSITEQLTSNATNEITVKQIQESLNLFDLKTINDLFCSILNKQTQNALKIFYDLSLNGINYYQLALSLLDLSINQYTYLVTNNQSLIKPSLINYVLNSHFELNLVVDFIETLKSSLEDIKKSINSYLYLKTFIVAFIAKSSSLNDNVKNEQTSIVNNSNTNINNQVNVNEVDTEKARMLAYMKQNKLLNNPVEKKDEYINSFIENKQVQITTNSNDQIALMQQRIKKLDESWRNEKLKPITAISTTTDVTNELIKTSDKTIDDNLQQQEVKQDDLAWLNQLINNKQLFYDYASYQLDLTKNKTECKEIKTKLDSIKNNFDSKYVLINDAFALVDKIVLVNHPFAILLVDNSINAMKFNKNVNNLTLLREIDELFTTPYLMLAYTKQEIKNYNKTTNSKQIDLNNLKSFKEKFNQLMNNQNQTFDYTDWTKKMLFGKDK